jgi:cytochrome c-type biogenesis protein CcmH/NrfF
LAGAWLAFSVTRRRARAADVAELSAEDQARVKALLEDTTR